MDAINEYVKTKGSSHSNGFWDAPRLVCNDGFSMSVQASKYHSGILCYFTANGTRKQLPFDKPNEVNVQE